MTITISGTLVGPSGEPLPWVNINIAAAISVPGASAIPQNAHTVAITSATGGYSFTLEDGVYSVGIVGPGITPTALGQAVVNSSSIDTDLITLVGTSGVPTDTIQAAINTAAAEVLANAISIGTVTTVAPGTAASVTNVGTATAAVLDFEIPEGETGATGPSGPTGATGATGPSGLGSAVAAGNYVYSSITVNGGQITAIASAAVPVTSFNTRTGTVTLESGDVTGALGYTPPNPAAAWTQNPGAGTNNQTPFLQAGDMIGAYVVNGLLDTVPSTASLTSTMPGGVAYVQGGSVLQRVVSPGATYTYAASSDTYVDLSYSGVFTYSAVANGATAPAVAANSLRLEKVVTDATQITGVTQLAPGASPFLQVTNGGTTIRATVATSTTDGTIAASTTMYYLVIPILSSGIVLSQAGLIASVTTGSTTATNSNTITWSAVTGALSYNIYEGPGNTVTDLPSFGLIGNTASTSFVDTGITPGAQVPGRVSSEFTVIPFSNIVHDTENAWDVATNSYTILKTGWWLVVANLRYQDSSAAGISYSLNADNVVRDSPSDRWFMTATPASGQIARQGAETARLGYFTQGERVSMFSYAGSPLTAFTCALTLVYCGA